MIDVVNIIDKSIGCVIVNKDWSKVLIVKCENHYGFPKGHMEGTENELETMRREVLEEVGLHISHEKILGRFEISFPIYNKNIQRIIVCYMIRYDDNIPLKLQEDEIDDALWVTWKEALELLHTSKQYLILIEAIKIVIIKKYRIKNIFAKIKNYDRIYIEYDGNEYVNEKINTLLINYLIGKKIIKYYLGTYILIDMFINNLDFTKIVIYKIKPIYNLYYIFGNNLYFNNYKKSLDTNNNFENFENLFIKNINYIIDNFNGLEIKNYFNNIKFNFGILWNLNFFKILIILI